MAKRSFEDMIKELENILDALEQGDLPLEEMLKLYGRGRELTAKCRDRLTVAEAVLQQAADRDRGGIE